MKPYSRYLLPVLIGAALCGCSNTQTPQAGPELTKKFAGGPMPESMRKQFEAGMAKNKAATQAGPPNGGKH